MDTKPTEVLIPASQAFEIVRNRSGLGRFGRLKWVSLHIQMEALAGLTSTELDFCSDVDWTVSKLEDAGYDVEKESSCLSSIVRLKINWNSNKQDDEGDN